jgi:two-component system chemotaxis sensor kinase CheA
MQQLMETFVVEAQEHLRVVSQGLLRLESAVTDANIDDLLAEMFRAAHSLKGAARAVGAFGASELAHALESAMGAIQTSAFRPDTAQFDLLYQTVDALSALVAALVSDAQPEVDVETLTTQLAALSADLSSQASRSDQSFSASPSTPVEQTATESVSQVSQHVTPLTKTGRQEASLSPVEAFQPISVHLTTPSTAGYASGTATSNNIVLGESVRVSTVKLDAIIEQVGELQVAQLAGASHLSRLKSLLEETQQCAAVRRKHVTDRRVPTGVEHHEENIDRSLSALLGDMQRLLAEMQSNRRQEAQLVDELEEHVLRTRLMPVSTILETFPRMVRDLARDLGKSVRLTIEGGDTEIDRSVLEQVKAPLTHLLRNAVDHGIEAPASRQAAGKSVEGQIRLSAAQRGNSIVIEISDDGAGINVENVRASAIQRNVLDPAEAERMNPYDLMWLIFRSGMSTRSEVTDVSGRGVGLDVVRDQLERLRGYIDLTSTPGQGTCFSLHLPLSVATTLCLLVESAGQLFAIPASGVLRVTRVQANQIGRAEGRDVVRIGERLLALHDLSALLALPLSPDKAPDVNVVYIYTVLLGVADQRVAIAVDTVYEVQDLVVKPLPQPFGAMQCITGASNLGTGAITLVLNAADLVRAARQGSRQRSERSKHTSIESAPSVNVNNISKILVVDDSFTTRSLERNILETAGYHVHVAADGVEAWALLQNEPVDLVVSDVMMPRMTGFDLTNRIRNDKRFANLPVVLVTAQESPEDRERGLSVGADAYLVKSAFDQDNLLNTVARLL